MAGLSTTDNDLTVSDGRPPSQLPGKKVSRIYAQRKAIFEPVNGQIKGARGLRVRRDRRAAAPSAINS
jgi:hypothetical protein